MPWRAECGPVVEPEQEEGRHRSRDEAHEGPAAQERHVGADGDEDDSRLVRERGDRPGGEAGRQRPSSPGERERGDAERPGRHVLEVRDRKRRDRASRARTRPAWARRTRARSPPRSGRRGRRRPGTRCRSRAARTAQSRTLSGGHSTGWRHAQGGGARQLEHRHPGCLVGVEVAVAARPVEGEGRVEAAVRAHAEVDERSRQAEPRDVLRVDRIDRRQRRDGDQGEEQQLPARPAPGKRRRRRPDELNRRAPAASRRDDRSPRQGSPGSSHETPPARARVRRRACRGG